MSTPLAPYGASPVRLPLVAVEAVVLRPSRSSGSGPWPVVALVVQEDPLRPLPAAPRFPSAVRARCSWRAEGVEGSLARLSVAGETPEPFSLEVVVPVAPMLDAVDLLAAGATLALTTTDRARGLWEQVRAREALDGLLLLPGGLVPELAEMAAVLRERAEAV